MTSVLIQEWLVRLAAALDLDADAAGHGNAILDLTQDAAHLLGRPAAPVTAFLVGLAAGRGGGSPEAVAAACQTARNLAESLTNPTESLTNPT